MVINICDISFKHAKYACNGDLTEIDSKIEWCRNFNNDSDLCFFTDMVLNSVDRINSKIKIAMLIEPISIFSNSYKFILGNYNKFNYVLTHNKCLLNATPNGIFYPHGGTWIDTKNWNIHNKFKNISIISSKKMTTFGHNLRHDIISKFSNKIDFVCGRGYLPIDNKIEALKDFRASIVVENCIINDYFTEKIIDCFLTGTIPIYWNDGFICNYFNSRGMLLFNNLDELEAILNTVDIEKYYNDNFEAIKENFDLAHQYANTETWIHDNILKGILKL